ncbi:aconitate hydratase [Lelliottia amnigena]|nr:aconitate hydratase [Lelliottia amnigena]PEG65142.1 aconitate hydratase [Lelliottia amnigena]
MLCCPTRYRAFTLQTAVSQEREDKPGYTTCMPHYDNESEENRRARRIP